MGGTESSEKLKVEKSEKPDLTNLTAIVFVDSSSLAALTKLSTTKLSTSKVSSFGFGNAMLDILMFDKYKVLTIILPFGAEGSVLPFEIALMNQLRVEHGISQWIPCFIPSAGRPVHLKLDEKENETKVIIATRVLNADRVRYDKKSGEVIIDNLDWPHAVNCPPGSKIMIAQHNVGDIIVGNVASTVDKMSQVAIEKRFKELDDILAIDERLWALNPTLVCGMHGVPTGIMGVHHSDKHLAMSAAVEKLVQMLPHLG